MLLITLSDFYQLLMQLLLLLDKGLWSKKYDNILHKKTGSR